MIFVVCLCCILSFFRHVTLESRFLHEMMTRTTLAARRVPVLVALNKTDMQAALESKAVLASLESEMYGAFYSIDVCFGFCVSQLNVYVACYH